MHFYFFYLKKITFVTSFFFLTIYDLSLFVIYLLFFLQITQICRPSLLELLRKSKYLIRKHRFEEVALQNPKSALAYLQTEMAAIVDQNNEEEREEVCIQNNV